MVIDHLLRFYWTRRPVEQPGSQQSKPKQPGRAVRRGLLCLVAVVAIATIGLSMSANATVRLAEQRNVIFDRLSTADGLSQAAVTAITQDQHGFIWIGTQEGLNRFDGYRFESFYHLSDQPGSISHHFIWDILSDSSGTLWIGTDAGLNRFNETTGTFEVIDLSEAVSITGKHSIYSLYEDGNQRLWIGSDIGLHRRDADGTISHFLHDPEDPASIGAGNIRSVFEDSRGIVWIGTEADGLYRFEPQTEEFVAVHDITLNDNYVRSIMEDNSGNLWVSTFNGGITVYHPTEGTRQTFSFEKRDNTSLAANRVRTMLKDDQGNIWIGSDGGLNLFREQSGGFVRYAYDPTDVHSISDNTVIELFQDAGGVIWVGTFNGIAKFNARTEAFPRFRRDATRENGLISNSIASFAESSNGDVWVGTFNGLHKWDAEAGQFVHLPAKEIGLTDDKVMSLAVSDDTLWVGTMIGGINLVENDQVVATMFADPTRPDSLSSNAVSRIYQDMEGNIWVTTYGGGVNKHLGGGKFKRFPDGNNPEGKFSDLKTVDIVEAADGTMWIATDGGGVIKLDQDTGKTEVHRHDPNRTDSISSDNVISLLIEDDVLWIGTRDQGMNQYDPVNNSFKRITKADGLASDFVYGMLADGAGRIWTSGGKGLSVYDPSNHSFLNYDSTHGLQSDDFNSGAYLELSDGSFLFGGNNGFNAFYPDRIRGNTYVPPVRIIQFSKFNETFKLPEPVYESKLIQLDYNDFVIGFEFTAMDYTAPAKNRFRYKLEGFDRDWVEVTGTRQVTYTNLAAGNYRFMVRASNNDGVWNEEGTSIKVVVSPPVWATWWAYLVYLVITIGIIYQLQKANELRLRREAEKRYSERLQLYIESLEEATDCVLIADSNKHLMYANNAIQSILGISPQQAVGRSILSLLFSEPADASLARTGLRSEGRWHGEVRSRRASEYVTTEITIAAVHDDSDNETAFVSIARDVTDRKKVEAELEEHRLNLQALVEERTTALKHEIAENKAVQRELANSLKEKELLLKEVHHRVKNNMQVISSLLNIQAETIADETFSGLLGESQQRIKSMSLIHENLYQSDNLLEIDFEDYINMLANSLHRFYTVPNVIVGLDIQVDNVALDIETAVPCGLIINELISNSLKHAFKGREGRGTVHVYFRNVGCRYVLEIGDDGNGLPAGFTLDSSTSMGMEIVSILTQQLDGRLHFDSVNGARFEISFPRKEKHDSQINTDS